MYAGMHARIKCRWSEQPRSLGRKDSQSISKWDAIESSHIIVKAELLSFENANCFFQGPLPESHRPKCRIHDMENMFDEVIEKPSRRVNQSYGSGWGCLTLTCVSPTQSTDDSGSTL